jgi:hypothetical protein
MDPNVDPDPAIFVSDLQDVNKNYLLFCLLRYFLKVHVQYFATIKIHREVTKH